MKKDIIIIIGIVVGILSLFGAGYGTGVKVQKTNNAVFALKATAIDDALKMEIDAIGTYQRDIAQIEGSLLLTKKPQATKDAITKAKTDMQADVDNLRQTEKLNKLK